jgi:hypothetical protein
MRSDTFVLLATQKNAADVNRGHPRNRDACKRVAAAQAPRRQR